MAGIKELFAKYDSQLAGFQEAFKDEFVARVKKKTPKVTGILRDGWEGTVKSNEIEIKNDVDYASFVEFGVPRHTRTTAWGKKTAPYEHPGQPAVGMMRTTALEGDQIAEVALQKVGLNTTNESPE